MVHFRIEIGHIANTKIPIAWRRRMSLDMDVFIVTIELSSMSDFQLGGCDRDTRNCLCVLSSVTLWW